MIIPFFCQLYLVHFSMFGMTLQDFIRYILQKEHDLLLSYLIPIDVASQKYFQDALSEFSAAKNLMKIAQNRKHINGGWSNQQSHKV